MYVPISQKKSVQEKSQMTYTPMLVIGKALSEAVLIVAYHNVIIGEFGEIFHIHIHILARRV